MEKKLKIVIADDVSEFSKNCSTFGCFQFLPLEG